MEARYASFAAVALIWGSSAGNQIGPISIAAKMTPSKMATAVVCLFASNLARMDWIGFTSMRSKKYGLQNKNDGHNAASDSRITQVRFADPSLDMPDATHQPGLFEFFLAENRPLHLANVLKQLRFLFRGFRRVQ